MELVHLCEFPANQEWYLVYRGSVDGFTTKKFHEKCDDIDNMLLVCKAANGNVFGGYTELPWSICEGIEELYEEDKERLSYPKFTNMSFIFSLVNKESMPMKLRHFQKSSITRSSLIGPAFGEKDYDLYIDLEETDQCISSLGKCYEHPSRYLNPFGSDSKVSDVGETLLAGSKVFEIVEIEAFFGFFELEKS